MRRKQHVRLLSRILTGLLGPLLLFGILHPAAMSQSPKVLLIGVDGMRPDALQKAIDQGRAPNFAWLIGNGTYCPNATTSDLTFSGPGWTDVLSGVHRDDHQVTTNSVSGNVFSGSNQAAFPDLLAIVKAANPAMRTARWTTWSPLSVTRTPGGTDYNFFHSYSNDGDRLATLDAARFYTDDNADVGFFYFGDVDIVGHQFGFNPRISPYIDEIATTDQLLGALLDAIRARPGYVSGAEDWLFIVCSDHGGNLAKGHSGNRPWDRRMPLIVSGNAVLVQTLEIGAKNVDVVPTALAHLGITPPSYLVGHAIGFTPSPVPPVELHRNLVFNGDAEFDKGFTHRHTDQAISGWEEFIDADYASEVSVRTGAESITTVLYGDEFGFPNQFSPGPPNRGKNFFCPGESSNFSSMVQLIDLTPFAANVDAREIVFDIAAYLGGRDWENDRCEFEARFLDEDGSVISREKIGPVTPEERDGVTGLLLRETSGSVPSGTRAVLLVLSTIGNDAYADDLHFQLNDGTACPDLVVFEHFDDVTLRPFDVRRGIGDGTDYSQNIPGWTIDNGGMSSESLETAFNGVAALDVDSWIQQQGVQIGRGSTGRFGVGQRNTALVFDPDAWADFSGSENRGFNSYITTLYDLSDRDLDSLELKFDWEFAAEASQRAIAQVSFDGGQNWQTLLDLDSDSIAVNTILGDQSTFNAMDDFLPTGPAMLLRIGVVDAGNNWWFAVDNVQLKDGFGVIRTDNFENLAMLPFSVANVGDPGDGTDYASSFNGWSVDNSQMVGISSEGAYQGWRVLDANSWINEQGGQDRSVLATYPHNSVLVADPDAWSDYATGAGNRGFNSFVTKRFPLFGHQPETLAISFDWEFRAEDRQRGTVEISFDNGQSYQMLLDLDSDDGTLSNNQILAGPSTFLAGDDFVVGGYEVTVKVGCRDAGNNWWFAIDNLMMQAMPGTCIKGDANGDGVLSSLDIDPFVLALVDPFAFRQAFPAIDPLIVLDFNFDGSFDSLDIDGFVAALLN